VTLEQLLRRPQVSWGEVVGFRPELSAHERNPLVVDQVVTEAKYAGYAQKQMDQVEKFRKLENRRIPASFDFALLPQLRFEAKEKLSRVRPTSLGQASRISGITPADLATVLMYLESGVPDEAEETHR
jgi:tRNA uridine 5-carboxymethylaminomethyl modification enzyme